MDENHQNSSNNKLSVTDDIKWVISKKSKLLIPQHKNQEKANNGWTGFSGRSLWDWMQFFAVLAIPIIVAAGTLFFTQEIIFQQSIASSRQHQTDIQIAADQERETALQNYIDTISGLLLNNNLLQSKLGDPVREVARVQTLNTLLRLDPTRKVILLRFLYEAKLIGSQKGLPNTTIITSTIISLSGADLVGVNLRDVDLVGIDLSNTILTDANLSFAYLTYANLSFANLRGANLSFADLSFANLAVTNLSFSNLDHTFLDKADLSNADLENTDLMRASLNSADLSGVNLRHANLNSATLENALLYDADLSYANLSFAYLGYTYLKGAIFTQQQLNLVESCNDAILPIGLTCPRTLTK